MIIWPIVTAITRTVWLPAPDGGTALLARDLRLLLLRPLQPRQPRASPSGPPASAPPSCVPICLSIALYLRFAEGRLAAYVQGLAIFPMFVPSIILSYAIIRVLGPNGTVDLLLNAVGLPKIRTPLPHALGPGDRPRLGQHPDHRADPALRPRRGLERSRSRPPATSAPAAGASSGTSSCRGSGTRSSSRSASPCSASSPPSRSPTSSARPRPR